MFKKCSGPLLIYLRWYRFPSCTYRSGEVSVARIRVEKHKIPDTIRLYKDTMHENAMELSDSLICAPGQQKLKIVERVSD